MNLPTLHRTLDHLAMWSEDWIRREPQGYRSGPEGPLACFGPLGPLPPPPAGPGLWRAPSPLDAGVPGDLMSVHCTAALGARRGTLLLVPPWKTGSPRLVSGYNALFARAGYDVWLVVPPHHLERTVDGQRAGEGFVSLDLARMRRAVEQLIVEIRICAAMAQDRGEVGLLGLSLGGLAAAFAATGPERIDFAALVAPPADMATILAETRIGRRYRELACRAGSPLPETDALRPAMAALDPARRAPTARRLFVAAGLHDRIVPRRGPVSLARAWGVEPALYPRGHISLLFLCRALRRDLVGFATGYRRAAR